MLIPLCPVFLSAGEDGGSGMTDWLWCEWSEVAEDESWYDWKPEEDWDGLRGSEGVREK